MVSEISHKDLCAVAVSWLRRPPSKGGPSCSFAVSETAPLGAAEIPDAIGWREGKSTLVEVKVSRADFLADRNKPHRAEHGAGMGCYRYFMVPAGMIKIDDLPPKWGLVEVHKGTVPKVVTGHVLEGGLYTEGVQKWEFPAALDKECHFLSRLFSRVGDPEAVNARLKEQARMVSWLTSALERERASVRTWQGKYWEACAKLGEAA